MTQTQKIIKYFAISLAILLIISIFTTIFEIASSIFGFSLTTDNNEFQIETVSNNIDVLDIEIDFSKLTFKIDNEFSIETNNNYIKVRENNNKIFIDETKKLFSSKKDNEIIIYVPKDKVFSEVTIEAGSGNIDIEYLKTNYMELDLGAGAINFDELNVLGKASIDSGAGKLEINSGIINNLDLDIGVGDVLISGKLTGNNEINAGVGSLKINLSNYIDNYKFIINKGIGKIKINNEIVKDNYYQSNGNNLVKIDGGMGNISINTALNGRV